MVERMLGIPLVVRSGLSCTLSALQFQLCSFSSAVSALLFLSSPPLPSPHLRRVRGAHPRR